MTVERGPRVALAELALAGVTASVAFGATRLFVGGSWIVPIFLTVVVVHGTSAAARRARLGIGLQALAVTIAEFLLISWVVASETFRYFLPSSETLSALGEALELAIEAYPTARAPVDASDGFIIAVAIGLTVVGLMADIAAFSLRAPLQALIPPFTLFALCSLLGSGSGRLTSTLLFLIASLGFVLTMRSVDQVATTTWMPGDQRRGPDAVLRVGFGLIAIATFGAVLIGPALPGAADAALWTWRGQGGGGSGSRTIVSPLVDVQTRLVNQSREIAFEVRSPEPSYWRMVSLDEFDGRRWRISSNFREVDGNFSLTTGAGNRTLVEQSVEIHTLNTEYLPAAYEPIAVDVESGRATFDDHSSTLLLDRRTNEGFDYTVTSDIPTFTADELRAAGDDVPGAVAERYLALPEMDPRVVDLAMAVTEGSATNYDRSLALQEFFRNEFEYSLDIRGGSDEEALVTFLFENRAGYCEQFAASFAAMARAVGVPTRVAVGFTEGERSDNRPELFTVRGANAHAWPEVYFSGIGWVPFEPTPGRMSPGSTAWTTLEEDAAPTDPVDEAEDPLDAADAAIPPELEPQLPEFDTGSGNVGAQSDSGFRVPLPLAVLLIVATILLGWVALISGAAWLRRSVRHRAVAGDAAARIDLAWQEAVEALSRRGRAPHASETRSEYAARVATTTPSVAVDVVTLATRSSQARYSGLEPNDDDVTTAGQLSRTVVRATTRHLPWYRRLLALGDPRRLTSARPRRSRRSATVLSPGTYPG